MSDDVKKKEENKEVSLSPEIEKFLDEWTKNPLSKVFVKLAEEYRKSGLLDEAKEVCEKGLKANPNYLSGNMVLAKVLFDKGEYDRSFEEVFKVTSVQTDNIMAQNLLLELYIKKGDKDNAIQVCDIISYLDPNNEEIKNKKIQMEKSGIIQEEEEEEEEEKTETPHDISDEDFQIEEEESEEDTEEFVLEDIDEEEEEEEGSEELMQGEFATNTVAELYIKQGFYEKGLNIYKEMLDESPNDDKLIEKINEIEKMMQEKESEEESAMEEPSGEEAEKEAAFSDPQEEEKEEQESVDKEEKINRLTNFLNKIQRRSHR